MSTFFRQTAQAMIAKHIDRFPLLKLDQVIDWQPIEQYLNHQRTPSAGIAEREILDMARFGGRLKQVLDAGGTLDETLFRGMGAVKIDEKLMMSEATLPKKSLRISRVADVNLNTLVDYRYARRHEAKHG